MKTSESMKQMNGKNDLVSSFHTIVKKSFFSFLFHRIVKPRDKTHFCFLPSFILSFSFLLLLLVSFFLSSLRFSLSLGEKSSHFSYLLSEKFIDKVCVRKSSVFSSTVVRKSSVFSWTVVRKSSVFSWTVVRKLEC